MEIFPCHRWGNWYNSPILRILLITFSIIDIFMTDTLSSVSTTITSLTFCTDKSSYSWPGSGPPECLTKHPQPCIRMHAAQCSHPPGPTDIWWGNRKDKQPNEIPKWPFTEGQKVVGEGNVCSNIWLKLICKILVSYFSTRAFSRHQNTSQIYVLFVQFRK